LALTDFQDQDIEEVLKRPAFCPTPGHEKKELEIFCKICEVSICNVCALTDHEGHAKMLLEVAANERKLQVQSVIQSQKQKAQQKRKKVAELDETCIHIEEQATAVKRDVHRFAKYLMEVIKEKEKEIFNEVDKQAKESNKRLRTEQRDVNKQAKLIDAGINKTETLLKRSLSSEIAQLDKSLNTIFEEEVSDGEDQGDCDLEGFRRFIFVKNESLMAKTVKEGIGAFKTFINKTSAHQSSVQGKGTSEAVVGLEAQFILTTRNPEGEKCYDEGDCVTVEMRNQQGQDYATKARIHDNKDGSYKISYFVKETGKLDLSVKANEDHVYGSPLAVEVKPRQFIPVSSFGQPGSTVGRLSFPWGVTVNEHNEIAVTDAGNNRIQVFSSDGTYLRSFGRKRGHKQGEFNWPAGIAFDKNGHIVVVDSNNHRVQVFSEQGKFLKQFGGEGSLDHQLKDPYGLFIDSDGNYIVVDSNNKLIKIFAPSGRFLRKIGGEGVFTFPYHCIQHDKYLLVSDCDEHCIKIFDRDGKFLYKFGKKGERKGEFNVPRCLSVNKAGHLMVCDTYNHRVQVFELSGKLVKMFGNKGSGIGEFKRPFSTAVLSDGRIIVNDHGNHRVQIFE